MKIDLRQNKYTTETVMELGYKKGRVNMSTVKKATETIKETAVEKKPVAKVAAKKAPAKKAEVKAAVETVAAEPVKEEVKKTTVKKETAKAAKKPVAKKATAKTTTAKKVATKKAAKAEVKVAIQFADKNYSAEDLAKIANDVWVYDYGKDASELKDVQLYVKPEESKVYYVFNNEIAGDFII